VLGNEDYHVELVLDATTGRLQAYILDGEMEDFVRSTSSSIRIDSTVDGKPASVTLEAIANPVTGETKGDTSLFEGQADWLRSRKSFEGVLSTLSIRGAEYGGVRFNFPAGNDSD
jgi:hypothetical protein